jgi:hypothetical protein
MGLVVARILPGRNGRPAKREFVYVCWVIAEKNFVKKCHWCEKSIAHMELAVHPHFW